MRFSNLNKPLRPVLLALAAGWMSQTLAAPVIDVHRDANCGCCSKWISYLESNGFTVNDHVETDMAAVKQRLGVRAGMGSCHTGVINGQFVEGHVPVQPILDLNKRPELIGIAVPGMPVGSPGMEHGERQDAYQVIGVDGAGAQVVVAEYPQR